MAPLDGIGIAFAIVGNALDVAGDELLGIVANALFMIGDELDVD